MTEQTHAQTFILSGEHLTRAIINRLFGRFPGVTLLMASYDKEQVCERVTFNAHAGEFTAIRDAIEVLGATVTTPHELTGRGSATSLNWGRHVAGQHTKDNEVQTEIARGGPLHRGQQ